MKDSNFSLHPDHLADIRKSGLSDETIAEARISSVPPSEIPKLLGWNPTKVESAYVIPYPDKDGFCRLKVFPPYKDKEGHTVKYLQPSCQGPYLYIPPGTKEALEAPAVLLLVTEGEKKALKAWQEEFPTIGLGGVWNFLKDGKPIEDLDLIKWEGREVFICFDSPDTTTNLNVMQAEYGLAQELQPRGAIIKAMRLPSENGEKVGLDDFLVAYGSKALRKLMEEAREPERPNIVYGKSLIDRGLDYEFILEFLDTVKLEADKDEIITFLSEKRKINVKSIGKDLKRGESKGPSQSDKLVTLAKQSGAIFFNDQMSDPYAYIPVSNHHEIWKLRIKFFRQWLSKLMWDSEQKSPNNEAIQSALTTLGGIAVHEGQSFPLAVRVSWLNEAIWYDLGNWKAVRVAPYGWQIVDKPPILFKHFPHQRPHLDPVDGDFSKILKFVNIPKEHHLLFLCYLMTNLIPDIPHPILVFHGDQGSAKTTALKIIKSLIDPSGIEVQTYPRNIETFIQIASHHWIYYLDNLSSLPEWLKDALCRGCTGEGFSKRELYSDDEDVIYSFKHCMGVSGINLVAESPDLLDRSLILGLERISENKCQEEKEVLRQFEEAKAAILGGLLSTLSKAMALYPEIKLTRKPRMADFAVWGCAVAKALGYLERDFLDAYEGNVKQQNQEAIDASPIAQAILAFMKDRKEWEGPSHELLGNLNEIANSLEIDQKVKAWPKDTRWLWRRIKEVRPNLIAMGVVAIHGRDDKSKVIALRKVCKNDGIDGIDGRIKAEQGIDDANIMPLNANIKNDGIDDGIQKPLSNIENAITADTANIFATYSDGNDVDPWEDYLDSEA